MDETPTERNKAVVVAFFGAIDARDWPAVEALADPEIVRHGTTPGSVRGRGRASLLAFLRGEAEAFPDSREAVRFLLAEGDKVAARVEFRGTQTGRSGPYPPTGRLLEAEFLAVFLVRDGLIAETWVEFDNLHSLIRLGHYEPPDDAGR